ncbi:hypothetical protein VP1G_09594 [Cytospora mali]|uniref:Rhodopsin domain-containing protein n=1 Tax=Cytospora mali TaxID=578113 RepID=A0A194VF28_CYTMA|nr:hypothetical protein VP1G_09594 [Valsa mali var. pyri (nom. inval.)]
MDSGGLYSRLVGVTVAILATILRFVATKRAARKPSWEDWCAVLTTFFFTIYVVPFLYNEFLFLTVMNGRAVTELTAEDIVKVTKAGYTMAAQFCLQQLFAKFSLLFLYYRIFSVNRAFVLAVYVIGAIQLSWSIATYVAHWLECTPPARLSNPKLPGSCIDGGAFLAVTENLRPQKSRLSPIAHTSKRPVCERPLSSNAFLSFSGGSSIGSLVNAHVPQ